MKIFLIIIFLFFSHYSYSKQIFFCYTKDHKVISIKEKTRVYEFSFGEELKKDIVFFNKLEDVEFSFPEDNDYTGRVIGTNLTLKNNGYEYNVYFSVDRTENTYSSNRYLAGVIVTKDSDLIAETECDLSKKNIINWE